MGFDPIGGLWATLKVGGLVIAAFVASSLFVASSKIDDPAEISWSGYGISFRIVAKENPTKLAETDSQEGARIKPKP